MRTEPEGLNVVETPDGNVYKMVPLKQCSYQWWSHAGAVHGRCEVWLDGKSYCQEHEARLKERAARDNSEKMAAAEKEKKTARMLKRAMESLTEEQIAAILELAKREGKGNG